MEYPRARPDQVSPISVPSPRASPDAFGGMQARALQDTAQTVTRLGVEAEQQQQLFEARAKEREGLRASFHELEYRRERQALDMEYASLVGEQALNGRAGYDERATALHRKYSGIGGSIGDETTRQRYLLALGEAELRSQIGVNSHYLSQEQALHAQTASIRGEMAVQELMRSPLDEGALQAFEAQIAQAAAAKAKGSGLEPGEFLDTVEGAERSALILKAIEGRAAGNADEAEQLLEHYADELGAEDKAAAAKTVDVERGRQHQRLLEEAGAALSGISDRDQARAFLGLDGFGLSPDAKLPPNVIETHRLLGEYAPKEWAPHVIAGVLGSVMGEGWKNGDLDPRAVGDGGMSHGIFQHNADAGRYQAGQAWTAQNGLRWDTLEGQVRFAMHEVETGAVPNQQALARLAHARTAEEAADIWTQAFEAPSIPHNERRRANARQVWSATVDGARNPLDPRMARIPVADRQAMMAKWDGAQEAAFTAELTASKEVWETSIRLGHPGFQTREDLLALRVGGALLTDVPNGKGNKVLNDLLQVLGVKAEGVGALEQLHRLKEQGRLNASVDQTEVNKAFEEFHSLFVERLGVAEQGVEAAALRVDPEGAEGVAAASQALSAAKNRVTTLALWAAEHPEFPLPTDGLKALQEQMAAGETDADKIVAYDFAASLALDPSRSRYMQSTEGRKVSELGQMWHNMLDDGMERAEALRLLSADDMPTSVPENAVADAWKAHSDSFDEGELRATVFEKAFPSWFQRAGQRVGAVLTMDSAKPQVPSGVEAAATLQYERLWRARYRMTGSEEAAAAYALAGIQRTYGVSQVSAESEGVVMKHPPEQAYSIGGDNSWMGEAIERDLESYASDWDSGDYWLRYAGDNPETGLPVYHLFYETADGALGMLQKQTRFGAAPVLMHFDDHAGAEVRRRRLAGDIGEEGREAAKVMARELAALDQLREDIADDPNGPAEINRRVEEVAALGEPYLANPHFQALLDDLVASERERIARRDGGRAAEMDAEQTERRQRVLDRAAELVVTGGVGGAGGALLGGAGPVSWDDAVKMAEREAMTGAVIVGGARTEVGAVTQEEREAALRRAREVAKERGQTEFESQMRELATKRQREEGRAAVVERYGAGGTVRRLGPSSPATRERLPDVGEQAAVIPDAGANRAAALPPEIRGIALLHPPIVDDAEVGQQPDLGPPPAAPPPAEGFRQTRRHFGAAPATGVKRTTTVSLQEMSQRIERAGVGHRFAADGVEYFLIDGQVYATRKGRGSNMVNLLSDSRLEELMDDDEFRTGIRQFWAGE